MLSLTEAKLEAGTVLNNCDIYSEENSELKLFMLFDFMLVLCFACEIVIVQEVGNSIQALIDWVTQSAIQKSNISVMSSL